MKVTLIQPKNEYWVSEFEPVNEKIPPGRYSLLNLLSIAAITSDVCEVQIIDERIDGIDFGEFRDLVGISVMTPDAPRAYYLANEFRKRNVTVVLGGIHPTFCTDEALANCDSVVVGEAEYTWPVLIKDYMDGNLQRLYRSNKLYDISKISNMPRHKLSDKENYAIIQNVQTTRGCPNKCNYCTIAAFNCNTYRKRPVSKVIGEIESIKEEHILFCDDNIVGDYRHAKELFRQMVPLNKKWTSQMTLSFADDDELLGLAAKSGCKEAFVGIESLSSDNLLTLNKTINRIDRIEEQIKKVKDRGIDLQAAFITGLENDDESVFDKIYEFCEKNDITKVNLWVFTPFPGTQVFDRMKSQNRIISYDWGKYDFQHVVIKPNRIKPEILQEKADKLRMHFNSRYWRSKRLGISIERIKKIIRENRKL